MDVNRHHLIVKLEQMAANSWPAPTQQAFEHWILRAGTGITMRANSVLTTGSLPIVQSWMDEITAFYAALSLPLRFHISAATDPDVDLDLEKHGLIIQSPSAVYQAACNQVLSNPIPANPLLRVQINNSLEDEWLEDFLRLEQHPYERKPAYTQIFSGIKLKICYLRIYQNEELVGLGSAVLEDGWAGLGNIITAANYRNKGIGTSIVQELAQWSRLNGANQLYLQVMQNNKAALNLYTRLGFTHVYDYHYRTRLNQ
ncbi:GNAT family N-acetyltransferase [Paenibacillus psychroresistens]|uniref:GNAT family N-acetyltransferase n=1 Tax=Paenibacillus psychroresistens TaxID=1778678 RepID=A0A6B8RM23_9BACL|nr:GNAT family N-acetyltransferase [Paenibacillus psychroresistens]QGQ96712.1 GNAT family N-acetyltransferase [Paenibacillus psychroresistens]